MRLLAVIAPVSLILTAAAGATTARGTLTGTVMRGPIAPVCALEQPCDEPAPHVALVFSHADAVVGRVTTDANGHYRLRLPALRYEVRRANAATIDRKLDPHGIRVYAGRVTHIDFSIDTGIR
jgi:hypothetical protein